MGSGAGREGNKELVFKGGIVSAEDEEKVLEMEGGGWLYHVNILNATEPYT